MGGSSSSETTAAPIPVELQQFRLGAIALVADHDPHDRPALLLRVAAGVPTSRPWCACCGPRQPGAIVGDGRRPGDPRRCFRRRGHRSIPKNLEPHHPGHPIRHQHTAFKQCAQSVTNALALMFPASGSQTAGAGGRRRVSPQRGGVVVDASSRNGAGSPPVRAESRLAACRHTYPTPLTRTSVPHSLSVHTNARDGRRCDDFRRQRALLHLAGSYTGHL